MAPNSGRKKVRNDGHTPPNKGAVGKITDYYSEICGIYSHIEINKYDSRTGVAEPSELTPNEKFATRSQ
jgi:hypothetical protein